MKKWLFLLCTFTLPCTMNAWSTSDTSDSCFEASFGAEALYWQPYSSDFIYGQFALVGGVLTLLDLEPEYDWGFRLFASIADPRHCNLFDVEWVKIGNRAKDLTNARADALLLLYSYSTSTPIVDSIEATQRSQYQKFSARLGRRVCGDSCRYVYGYLGGRWFYINLSRRSLGSNVEGGGTLGIVEQKTSFRGGAIEGGVGAEVPLWRCLGTSLRFGGISAIGDTGFSVENNLSGGVSKLLDEKHTRCIVGFEIRADLNYTYRCNYFWMRGEVGYELNYYSNPLIFGVPIGNTSTTSRSDFGIGGLIFGVTVGY